MTFVSLSASIFPLKTLLNIIHILGVLHQVQEFRGGRVCEDLEIQVCLLNCLRVDFTVNRNESEAIISSRFFGRGQGLHNSLLIAYNKLPAVDSPKLHVAIECCMALEVQYYQ